MKNSSDTVIQDIILIEDGNFINDTEEVCDIFNQYFINIGISIVNENDNDFSACLTRIRDHFKSYQASFKFSNVDTNTVMKKLRKLNIKKATRYDGLSTTLIRIAAPKLVTSLTCMINRYINDCVFPLSKNGKCVPSI